MGDNIWLGDRDGVRDADAVGRRDRNGGFSQVDPQRLYLPPIMDAIYGYQALQRRGAAAQRGLAAAVDPADDRDPQAALGPSAPASTRS